MKEEKLPSNLVVIENNQVVRVDHWVNWNGIPVLCVQIGRQLDPERRAAEGEFYININDPEHGGFSRRGSLKEVLEAQHENFHPGYIELFDLENPDIESIRAIKDFKRYKVKVLDEVETS